MRGKGEVERQTVRIGVKAYKLIFADFRTSGLFALQQVVRVFYAACITRKGKIARGLFLVLFLSWGQGYAAQETAVPDPCTGFLAIIGRPTVSDSPCAVPAGRVVLEVGFQRAKLRGPGGTADNYPEAVVRIGLPGKNEFVFLPSNYNRQKTQAGQNSPSENISGLSAVTIGFKHELGYDRRWLGAAEALLTLPSGGESFGSEDFGAAFNGIVSYSVSEQVSLSLQLGVSSQTTPALAGGERFTSVISNIVATWQPLERLQFFGELFGQSSTGPGEGAGYNADGGVQYLLAPAWEIDLEGGLRVSGNLGGLNHYFGMGIGHQF